MVSSKSDSVTSESKRKFRVLSLKYPVDLSHPKISMLMLSAQSFHMWFERALGEPSQQKVGGLSLVFDTPKQAALMYREVEDVAVEGGLKLTFQVGQSISDEAALLPKKTSIVSNIPEDPDLAKKLFISNLLPSADHDLVLAIFGKENLKKAVVKDNKDKKDGSKCAFLVFNTEELAKSALDEFNGFTIDDGEMSRPMKIITHKDYLIHGSAAISTSKVKSRSHTISEGDTMAPEEEYYLTQQNREESTTSTSNDAEFDAAKKNIANKEATVVVDEENLSMEDKIERLMVQSRVRWDDLHTAADLWMVLDQVSKQHKCEDDQVALKKGMTSVLREAKEQAGAEWQVVHMKKLIALWRIEQGGGKPKVAPFEIKIKSKPVPPAISPVKVTAPAPALPAIVNGVKETKTVEKMEKSPPPVPPATVAASSTVAPGPPPKQNYDKPKNTAQLMGVGSFLAGMKTVDEAEEVEKEPSPKKSEEPAPPPKPVGKRTKDSSRKSKHSSSKRSRRRRRSSSMSTDSSSDGGDKELSKSKLNTSTSATVPSAPIVVPPPPKPSQEQMMRMMISNMVQPMVANMLKQPGASLPLMLANVQKMTQSFPATTPQGIMAHEMERAVRGAMSSGMPNTPSQTSPGMGAAAAPAMMQQMMLTMQTMMQQRAAMAAPAGIPNTSMGSMVYPAPPTAAGQVRPQIPSAAMTAQQSPTPGMGGRIYAPGGGMYATPVVDLNKN